MQAARNVAARAALVIGALVFGAAAQAQSLSARAGSNGLGAELSAGFGSMFGMRANVLGGSYDRDEVQSDIRYEGQLKLSNAALLLDLHPLSGTFRLSAGLVYNDNKLDATGRGDGGTIEINGISYPASVSRHAAGGGALGQSEPVPRFRLGHPAVRHGRAVPQCRRRRVLHEADSVADRHLRRRGASAGVRPVAGRHPR
jgi:hypothetical protein